MKCRVKSHGREGARERERASQFKAPAAYSNFLLVEVSGVYTVIASLSEPERALLCSP